MALRKPSIELSRSSRPSLCWYLRSWQHLRSLHFDVPFVDDVVQSCFLSIRQMPARRQACLKILDKACVEINSGLRPLEDRLNQPPTLAFFVVRTGQDGCDVLGDDALESEKNLSASPHISTGIVSVLQRGSKYPRIYIAQFGTLSWPAIAGGYHRAIGCAALAGVSNANLRELSSDDWYVVGDVVSYNCPRQERSQIICKIMQYCGERKALSQCTFSCDAMHSGGGLRDREPLRLNDAVLEDAWPSRVFGDHPCDRHKTRLNPSPRKTCRFRIWKCVHRLENPTKGCSISCR